MGHRPPPGNPPGQDQLYLDTILPYRSEIWKSADEEVTCTYITGVTLPVDAGALIK
jgi:hypothetical protein